MHREQKPCQAIHWHVTKTLASQLEMLGVKPSDIKYVAISHSHPDHVGNIAMFPQSTVLVQKAEYDWPAPFGQKLRAIASPVIKLEGDHDVFGDGSVTLLATPGHTPGHQSQLVKLPKTKSALIQPCSFFEPRATGRADVLLSRFMGQILVYALGSEGGFNRVFLTHFLVVVPAQRLTARHFCR